MRRTRVVSVLLVPSLAVTLADCSNVGGAGNGGGTGASCAIGDDGGDDAGSDDAGSSCAPSDSDGIVGGCYTFDVTVDDTGFSPVILKAQNRAAVTLNLRNTGSKAHDFVLGCIPESYAGCPPQSCFPAAANVGLVQPGASVTTTFVTPNPEGIYNFRSDVPGDAQVDADDGGVTGLWGQFVVQ